MFAYTNVFDTFTKLFFLCFTSAAGKNILANQSYMQKTTYYKWAWDDASSCTLKIHGWHHKGRNNKSHVSALTFQKSCLFVNEWTYEPIHYLSESQWLLSTIFRIPVNLAFSLPLPVINWDRLIIAPMCLHSSLTLMHTHSQTQM